MEDRSTGMDQPIPTPRESMIRYVAAFSGFVIAERVLFFAAANMIDFDSGPSTSTANAITIAAIAVALIYFTRHADRPMTAAERLRFASGVTLADSIIEVAMMAGLLWIAGLPVSPEGFDLVLGGRGFLYEPALLWLMAFVVALVFAQAYFLAWLMTRKLPRKRRNQA